MKKAVLLLLMVLVLVACGKSDIPTNETNTTALNSTNATIEEEALGRLVIAVTDAPVAMADLTEFTLGISNVELYNMEKDSWKKIATAKTEFDIALLKDTGYVLLDVETTPETFEQIRFRIDVEGVFKEENKDLELPYSTLTLPAKVTITDKQTSTILIDFTFDALDLIGPSIYWKPTIHIVTRNNADVTVDNKLVTITNGDIITDETKGFEDLFTQEQITNQKGDCVEDCQETCTTAGSSCGDECQEKVTNGCETEDEETCRDACTPYIAPWDCRDGCQEDTSDECIDYLEPRCTSDCGNQTADCKLDCDVKC
ncbi:DUF4382 domain-containing protein [Candidatus Woesearchaeota archaeon]|nr:DUF4382 domain-containing protein [Candidatus Woesearchaeota archaeon]